jgi:hypothetical protein
MVPVVWIIPIVHAVVRPSPFGFTANTRRHTIAIQINSYQILVNCKGGDSDLERRFLIIPTIRIHTLIAPLHEGASGNSHHDPTISIATGDYTLTAVIASRCTVTGAAGLTTDGIEAAFKAGAVRNTDIGDALATIVTTEAFGTGAAGLTTNRIGTAFKVGAVRDTGIGDALAVIVATEAFGTGAAGLATDGIEAAFKVGAVRDTGIGDALAVIVATEAFGTGAAGLTTDGIEAAFKVGAILCTRAIFGAWFSVFGKTGDVGRGAVR